MDLQSWDLNRDGFLDRNEIEQGLIGFGATQEDASKTADRALSGATQISMIEAGSINSLQKKIDTLAELRSKLNNVARTQNQRQQQQQQQQNNNGQPSLPQAPGSTSQLGRSGRKKKMKGPVLDKRMIALLARLVDERMNNEFQNRDKILVEMRDSMEIMRGELEQNMMIAQATANQMQSPSRPPGARGARGSPLTSQRLVQPGVTSSSLINSVNRGGALGGSGRNEYQLKGNYVPRDDKGRVLLSAKNMPRVSMLVPDDEETRKALRKQAAAADAEYRRSIVRYKQCRSTVFMPTGYIPPSEPGNEHQPTTSLDLEFVHGYSGKLPYRTTSCTNIFPLATGELVYPCSATVVIYDKIMHRQRFFFGHDDDVMCLAVHPSGTIVASGQVGRRPPICIWDCAKPQSDPNDAEGNGMQGGGPGSNPTGGGMSSGVTHLGNLLFHSRGIACMDFSTDGTLLVSVGADDAHHICVWDWQNGVLLASGRGYNTDVFQVAFNPINYQGIGAVDDLDDVTYTIITAGRRHIKFWSLFRETPDSRKKTPQQKDLRDMQSRDKRQTLRRKGGLSGSGSKEWKLEGNTGGFGRAGKLQDIRCFCFMPGGQVVSGTQSGHLYVWEQPRDMALEVRYTDEGREVMPIRWASSGSLLGIIPNAHDSPVTCIAHDPTQPTTFMTAGKDGVLVAWNIGFSEQRKLIHAVVKTVDLPREQTGGGHPVSLYYLAPFGPADSIAVGLSSNSILEVKVNSSELCLLITAHSGVLEAVAEHPFKPFYVTAGREKMVRVWDASARGLLCRARIHAPASCAAWSPDGTTLVIGTIQGDFAVLSIGEDGGARNGLQSVMVKQLLRTGANNLAAKTQQKKKARENKGKTEMTPLQRKMRAMQGEMSDSPTSQKPFKRHEEVQDLKFSPDGSKLAVASRDNNIYIYNCLTDDGDFQIIGVCRGHSSYVTHIDWSEDSTSLQSNDGTYELLYWDANTAKQITSSYAMRDAAWNTYTCTMGWPVQAIWKPESDGTDVNACSRAAGSEVVVTGDDFGMVRMFRYPCVRGGGRGKGPLPPAKVYRGHMSHVMNTRFLAHDTHLISVGGNDAAVFQWRHCNHDGSTVRTTVRSATQSSDNNSNFGEQSTRVSARGKITNGHGFY